MFGQLLISWSINILDLLLTWDRALFLWINRSLSCGVLDKLMPMMRDQRTWYPFYAVLLVFSVVKFKRKAIPFVLIGVAALVLGDQISSSLLKPLVGRVRPCREPLLEGMMSFRVGYCPKSGSFTSSHAVNHFVLALYFFYVYRPYFKRYAYLFFLWAIVVCYAQIYVGVHYPADVVAGALLGMGIGGLAVKVLFKYGWRDKAPDLIRRSSETP